MNAVKVGHLIPISSVLLEEVLDDWTFPTRLAMAPPLERFRMQLDRTGYALSGDSSSTRNPAWVAERGIAPWDQNIRDVWWWLAEEDETK